MRLFIVQLFNRSIEATLESLDGLERFGLLRAEDLNEHKIRIEHARAQANEDLTDRLQDYETEESVRFDRMELELEKRREDPNDVFSEPVGDFGQCSFFVVR